MKKTKQLIVDAPKFFVPFSSDVAPIKTSERSTMRCMAVFSLLTGAAIAVIGILRCEDLSHLSVLCSIFVTPAFVGKAVQKHIELKGGASR